MSILAVLRDMFDAPRFCPDDGEPIEVTNVGAFDERTGEPYERWVWRCPKVSVHWDGGSIEWSQHAVHRVHAHGTGKPHWYADA